MSTGIELNGTQDKPESKPLLISKGIELNVTQDNLEQLRCSVCKDYLSCAPIRITSEGSNLCGQCIPLTDTQTSRQLILEAILSDAVFPCRYSQRGCSSRLLFNHTIQHESRCTFRPVDCPYVPRPECRWKDCILDIPSHFVKEHPDYVKENAEFSLDLSCNKYGFVMVSNGQFSFLIRFWFSRNTKKLQYGVFYFEERLDAFCKIRLTNELDPDYNFNLKGGKLVVFSGDPDDNNVINLESFLENLNSPKSLLVSFSVALSMPTQDIDSSKVNYDVLESLKCIKCDYYLIVPLFDNSEGTICARCYDNGFVGTPSTNTKLQNLASGLNFPCRWHGCSFITKGNFIRSHEAECKHRLYRCLVAYCTVTFTQAEAAQHLEKHNYKQFDGTFTYKTSLAFSRYASHIFTFINDEIVVVKMGVPNRTYIHFLSLRTAKLNAATITAAVHFEHKHCKCKSKKFTFDSGSELCIGLPELPQCFRANDELTAVLLVE